MTDSIRKDKDAGGHGSNRRGFFDAMRGPTAWRAQSARHRVRDARAALERFKSWYYPMVRSEHLAKGPAPLDLKDEPAAAWGPQARGKVPQKKRTRPNDQVEPLRTGTAWQSRMGGRQANEAQAARWLENFGGSSAKDAPPKYDPGAEESIRQAHSVARGNYAPNLSTLPMASGANTVSHLKDPMYQPRLRIKKLREELKKYWSDEAREASAAVRAKNKASLPSYPKGWDPKGMSNLETSQKISGPIHDAAIASGNVHNSYKWGTEVRNANARMDQLLGDLRSGATDRHGAINGINSIMNDLHDKARASSANDKEFKLKMDDAKQWVLSARYLHANRQYKLSVNPTNIKWGETGVHKPSWFVSKAWTDSACDAIAKAKDALGHGSNARGDWMDPAQQAQLAEAIRRLAATPREHRLNRLSGGSYTQQEIDQMGGDV